ncbi:MAG: helix-turn-helix domain-containing protein, partial [Arenibacterium sp.]
MSTITPFPGDGTSPETDAQVAALIRQVGAEVRALREARGIPRRALSDRSGVSPRYLAQLEAGEGNISIGLLQRIA